MKIMVRKNDMVRLMIISKKLTAAAMDDKKIVDLKMQYYAYMISYYNSEKEWLEVSKCYK